MSTTFQTTGTGSVYIQNLAFNGNSIVATNENGSVNFIPNGNGVIGFGDVGFNNGAISTTLDNLDLVLAPNGTGTVKTGNLQLDGNTISTTDVDGNLVLAPNGNGNVGVGTSSPNAKLHVQGPFMQSDSFSHFVRKTMPSMTVVGTYNYVLLGKAATVSGVNMPASYAIGKIVFRRGDTNAYNFVDVIHVMSSRGYDNETFSANIEHCGTGTTPSNVPNGTKFVRLVKCTYDSIEYHAVEISGSGGNNTHEQTFEGYSVDAGLLYVGEGLVSNVTSYGNLGVVSHTNGNVGIGTSTPSKTLHVYSSNGSVRMESSNGRSYTFATSGTSAQGFDLHDDYNNERMWIYLNQEHHIYTAGAEKIRITSDGNVGIATNDPKSRLHVVEIGSVSDLLATAARSYIQPSGLISNTSGSGLSHSSIYATGYIISSSLIISHGSQSFSDRRIKSNIIDVEDDSCLQKLRMLKPKQYTYKDTISKGTSPVWGFIAQEVSETLEYAVEKMEKCIPNVYKLASVSEDGYILSFEEPISLEPLDNIKLQLKTFNSHEHDVNVVEVLNSTSIRIAESLSEEHHTGIVDDEIIENQIFVYGQYVDDFHVLKKDAIFTVAVAALQEVDRRQVADNERILELEGEVSFLKEENNLLKQQLASIASRLSAAGL